MELAITVMPQPVPYFSDTLLDLVGSNLGAEDT